MKVISKRLFDALELISKIFNKKASDLYLNVSKEQKTHNDDYGAYVSYVDTLLSITQPNQLASVKYLEYDRVSGYQHVVQELTKLRLFDYYNMIDCNKENILNGIRRYHSAIIIEGDIVSLPIIELPKWLHHFKTKKASSYRVGFFNCVEIAL